MVKICERTVQVTEHLLIWISDRGSVDGIWTDTFYIEWIRWKWSSLKHLQIWDASPKPLQDRLGGELSLTVGIKDSAANKWRDRDFDLWRTSWYRTSEERRRRFRKRWIWSKKPLYHLGIAHTRPRSQLGIRIFWSRKPWTGRQPWSKQAAAGRNVLRAVRMPGASKMKKVSARKCKEMKEWRKIKQKFSWIRKLLGIIEFKESWDDNEKVCMGICLSCVLDIYLQMHLMKWVSELRRCSFIREFCLWSKRRGTAYLASMVFDEVREQLKTGSYTPFLPLGDPDQVIFAPWFLRKYLILMAAGTM